MFAAARFLTPAAETEDAIQGTSEAIEEAHQ